MEEGHRDFDYVDYEKQHYSLAEIARLFKRPRTTLQSWADLFKPYLKTTGTGRGARYDREAIEVFQLIAKMKDNNEPNEAIERQLQNVVTEVIIPDQDEKRDRQPYIAEVLDAFKQLAQTHRELNAKYEYLSEDVGELKDMVYQMNENINRIADQSIKEEVSKMQENLAASLDELKTKYDEQLTTIEQEKTTLIELRDKRTTAYITMKRIESALRKEATAMWEEKPLEERLRKVGLFKKEEDTAKRESFIQDYIAEHIDERLTEEIPGD